MKRSALLEDKQYLDAKLINVSRINVINLRNHDCSMENFYYDATEQEFNDFINLSAQEIHQHEFNVNPHLLVEMLVKKIKKLSAKSKLLRFKNH